MEDVSREYDWHRCNVPACDARIERRLLCGEHAARYLSSVEAEKTQKRVHRRILGVQTRREIWKDRIELFLHYLLMRRGQYPQHFLSEALFLWHYRRLKKRVDNFEEDRRGKLPRESVTKEAPEALIQEAQLLEADFDCPENIYIDKLRALIGRLSGGRPRSNVDEYDISAVVPSVILPQPRTHLKFIGVLIVLFVLVGLLNAQSDLGVQTTLGLAFSEIGAILFAVLAFGYFGLRFFHSIQPVTERAFNGTLFQEDRQNKEFLQMVLDRRGDTLAWTERFAATAGLIVMIGILVLQAALRGHDLSLGEGIATVLVNLIAAPVVLQLGMTYPVLSGLTGLVFAFPAGPLRIDLYRPDGRLGLNEVADFLQTFLVWNLFFYILLFAAWGLALDRLSGFWPLLLVLVATYPLMVMRNKGVRLSWRTLRAIRRQVGEVIETERAILTQERSDDVRSRWDFLQKLDFGILRSPATRELFSKFLWSIVIPVGIVLASRYADAIRRLLMRVREGLQF